MQLLLFCEVDMYLVFCVEQRPGVAFSLFKFMPVAPIGF